MSIAYHNDQKPNKAPSRNHILTLKRVLIISNDPNFVQTISKGFEDMREIMATNSQHSDQSEIYAFLGDPKEDNELDKEFKQFTKYEVKLLKSIPFQISPDIRIDIEQDALALKRDKIENNNPYDVIFLEKRSNSGTRIQYIAQYWNALNIKINKIPIIAFGDSKLEMEALTYGIADFIPHLNIPIIMLRLFKVLKTYNKKNSRMRVGEFEVCLQKRKVYLIVSHPVTGTQESRCLGLTEAEFKVALLFLENADTIVTKQQILSALGMQPRVTADLKLADVYVCKLRTKIAKHLPTPASTIPGDSASLNGHPSDESVLMKHQVTYISTIWALGFKLSLSPQHNIRVVKNSGSDSDIHLPRKKAGRPSKKSLLERAANNAENQNTTEAAQHNAPEVSAQSSGAI